MHTGAHEAGSRRHSGVEVVPQLEHEVGAILLTAVIMPELESGDRGYLMLVCIGVKTLVGGSLTMSEACWRPVKMPEL